MVVLLLSSHLLFKAWNKFLLVSQKDPCGGEEEVRIKLRVLLYMLINKYFTPEPHSQPVIIEKGLVLGVSSEPHIC